LAIAAVYDGMSRTDAARVGGMDRQTLRDWVWRFNAEGPEGLTNRQGAGRPRLLSDYQMNELAGIVEAGPDLPEGTPTEIWWQAGIQQVNSTYRKISPSSCRHHVYQNSTR